MGPRPETRLTLGPGVTRAQTSSPQTVSHLTGPGETRTQVPGTVPLRTGPRVQQRPTGGGPRICRVEGPPARRAVTH